jgi:UDP-2,3-diacylglucosamine hydrolase
VQAWFVSDLHLKDINERGSVELLRFFNSLESGARPATHLFLLGDIFDLWIGSSGVFIRKFLPLIESLVRLKKKGISIIYVEGNHDMFLGEYFRDQLGFETYVEAQILEVGPFNIRIEHGDMINHQDLAYQRLRSTLRHPIVERILKSIPAQALQEIGSTVSQISRRFSTEKRQRDQNRLRQMIRDYAVAEYKKKAFDIVISGHMHIRDDFEFEIEGQSSRSVNLGSWFDGNFVFHLYSDSTQNQKLCGDFVDLLKT